MRRQFGGIGHKFFLVYFVAFVSFFSTAFQPTVIYLYFDILERLNKYCYEQLVSKCIYSFQILCHGSNIQAIWYRCFLNEIIRPSEPIWKYHPCRDAIPTCRSASGLLQINFSEAEIVVWSFHKISIREMRSQKVSTLNGS